MTRTDQLLTIADLADRLRVSEKTAKNLVYGDKKRGKEPEIASFLIGERMRRIDPAVVDAYVARSQQAEH